MSRPEASKLDVVAFGAHPDDVELACGGTLALLVERGYRVGIVHLTRGERGTRGTVAEREAEARAAAAALGVEVVRFLNCVDGGLRTGEAYEDAVIEVIREHRPELLFAPPPADRHPDHARGHRLVAAAAFYAGLARRGQGEPHRPAAVFCYMEHDLFIPSFIVDVTATWEKKRRALGCYGSQFFQPGAAGRDEPMTKVSSPEFAAALVGRAQHYGQLIGAAYGEPFWCRQPLAVGDPMLLLPGGLR
ncbi:MAG: bacillithiol biosynthesis deacetylase BshB1 [Acidobacteria bacterium]|nr:MAG: bacillithiol biosynthesis deacetylase BshB1 [Acidobacteriota bacterium]